MKKIISSILLLILFLNIIGYHFIFQVQQHKIKEDMEAYLHHLAGVQNTIELKISLDDKAAISKLQWEDENEFSLNGELYDVIQKKKENGELVIQCIKDKKETHLVNDYTKLSKETQGDPSKNKSTVLLKLIAGIFIKNEPPVVSVPIFENGKRSIISTGALSSGTKEILIPPPQVC